MKQNVTLKQVLADAAKADCETFYCPQCGARLQQGQYGYDCGTANLHVAYCPECGEVGGVVLNNEQAIKKYCMENVENFAERYGLALDRESKMRCNLQYADHQLYSDLYDKLVEWCEENGESADEYDIEDIF